MKLSKRYLVFALLVLASLAWKLNNWGDRYANVVTFRGAQLNEDVLYPLMSKNLNDSGKLSLYLNGTEFSYNDAEIMLDNSLNPVASLDFIRDTLRGSAFKADESYAVLQVTDTIYEFLVDNATATEDGDDYELTVKPSSSNGNIYIGIEDLCKIFGYSYAYDPENYDITINMATVPTLPSSYDLREVGRVSEIRDQGSTSTCWACASLEALESSLLPAENYIFSVDSMISDNSFGLDASDGGDYTMALAYLLSWQGPALTEESYSKFILPDIAGTQPEEIKVHLQEAQFYDSEDLDDIKWAIYRYGGVSTSIYANVSTSNLNKSTYYNRKTNSYCYMGSLQPNHDVVIIGWDDSYPASAFSVEVPGDGAFICQNSWGSGFGDEGVFYISYYDTNIGNQAVSYVKTDTQNKYSYIYQSDLCGWVGQIGYNKEWAYGANIFASSAIQQVEAAGFYALKENTSYQVYFVSEYENTSSLARRELMAEGTLEQAGYYTIKFSSPKTVTEGENFAIVVYVNSPGTERPVAVEYAADENSQAVDITDGVGYISNNGLDWESVEDVANANLCIKAYANNIVEVFE